MMPIRRIPFPTLAMAVLFAMLLAGCDGDREAAEPRFDLTGSWTTGEPADCEFDNLEGLLGALFEAVLDNPEFAADGMGGDLEQGDLESDLSAVTSNAFHLEQVGNDLEVTFEDADGSEVRVHGTITGDRVHLSQSETRDLHTLTVDLHTEFNGTVLDEDRLVLTQESDWAVRVTDGEAVTGGVSCTFHATRN